MNMTDFGRIILCMAFAVLAASMSSAQDKGVVYCDASAFPLYGKCIESGRGFHALPVSYHSG